MPRTFDEEMGYLERQTPSSIRIKKGFVPNMNVSWNFRLISFSVQVEGRFYVNKTLENLMYEELKISCEHQGIGGFLPAVKQIANVASLPGVVGVS